MRGSLAALRARFQGLSFRARLTLAAAGAVAVVVVVASAVAYVLVRNELFGNVNNTLTGRIDAIVPGPPAGSPSKLFNRLPTPEFGQSRGYYQVVSADGTVSLPHFEDRALIPVGKKALQVAAGDHGQFFQDQNAAGLHVRVLTVPVVLSSAIDGTQTTAALQVAEPLTDVDSVLGRLQWILLLVALGGVGAAVLLGLLVTRAALVPVRRLTDATEEITETRDLSRRVDAPGQDELARLGTSFNTMLAALEESQQAQLQLVADASHELRTPLTSLRTNVELLARGGLPEDERKKALADVATQLEELTVLVTDVVDLAREGERELAVEDVRLDLLVSDAIERAHLHAPKVEFETDLSESLVRGVPERIFRAVANVLDNAAKYSPAGGKVEVKAADGEVSVRDHGPGIAAEDLPHVFDRFYRSPAARGTPGSGLGLAIVRQVVESHGGTVSAAPANGGGTIVRLAFPPG